MKVIYCTNQPYNRILYIDDNIRDRTISTNSSLNLNVGGHIDVTSEYFRVQNDFFVDGTAEFNGDVYLPTTTSYRGFTLNYLFRMNAFLFG